MACDNGSASPERNRSDGSVLVQPRQQTARRGAPNSRYLSGCPDRNPVFRRRSSAPRTRRQPPHRARRSAPRRAQPGLPNAGALSGEVTSRRRGERMLGIHWSVRVITDREPARIARPRSGELECLAARSACRLPRARPTRNGVRRDRADPSSSSLLGPVDIEACANAVLAHRPAFEAAPPGRSADRMRRSSVTVDDARSARRIDSWSPAPCCCIRRRRSRGGRPGLTLSVPQPEIAEAASLGSSTR